MNNKSKMIITIILLTVIPVLAMLPFAITRDRMDYVEIGLVIFGCLELIVLNVRTGRRERDNRKKYNRYKSDPQDEGFDDYRRMHNTLIISGIVNIVLSVVWFYIFTF